MKLLLGLLLFALLFAAGCIQRSDTELAKSALISLNPEECWQISDYELKYLCINHVAYLAADVAVCDKYYQGVESEPKFRGSPWNYAHDKTKENSEFKDDCYYAVAASTGNFSMCDRVSNYFTERKCRLRITWSTEDISYCEKINEADNGLNVLIRECEGEQVSECNNAEGQARFSCKMGFLNESSDPDICKNYSNTSFYGTCIIKICGEYLDAPACAGKEIDRRYGGTTNLSYCVESPLSVGCDDAIEHTEDPELCRKYDRDGYCYWSVGGAIGSHGEIGDCEMLEQYGNGSIQFCYREVAVATSNLEVCDLLENMTLLEGESEVISRESCYKDVLFSKLDFDTE